ncbi:MAG: endolytic transglycosylase MltG [Trichloromonadaceae bacterium]
MNPSLKSIGIGLVLASILLALLVGGQYVYFLLRPVTPPGQRVIIIETGASFSSIAKRLQERGVISNVTNFKLLARWRDVGSHIQAGSYEFARAATPGEVLTRLTSGDTLQQFFTIPEGFSLSQIAEKLEAEGCGPASSFMDLAVDPEFIKSLDLEVDSLEGYLFPATYAFGPESSQDSLIRSMVRQAKKRLTPELLAQALEVNLNQHQLLTLASIIQKEAGNKEEMPIISSVFHNRLKIGMRLQADPTVVYGLTEFSGRITKKHLATTTPYNTYRISGLPAGPIACPGEDALRAAANPAETDFLYFAAKGDRTHIFSRTLSEHNAAVRKYIRKE